MATATNGGKWDDGHYCDDHKALWMKRARAAIAAIQEEHVIISKEEYRQINN